MSDPIDRPHPVAAALNEARMVQFRKDLAALERHWRAMPWLCLGFLACVPAGLWYGQTGVVIVVLILVYVIGVAIYITQGNMHRVRQHIEDLERRQARDRRASRATGRVERPVAAAAAAAAARAALTDAAPSPSPPGSGPNAHGSE